MKKQANPILNEAIMEAVDIQLRELNPPEAKETYDRLFASGYSDGESRRLIACALVSEIYDVMKSQKAYNPDRYIKCLRKLPKLPWD